MTDVFTQHAVVESSGSVLTYPPLCSGKEHTMRGHTRTGLRIGAYVASGALAVSGAVLAVTPAQAAVDPVGVQTGRHLARGPARTTGVFHEQLRDYGTAALTIDAGLSLDRARRPATRPSSTMTATRCRVVDRLHHGRGVRRHRQRLRRSGRQAAGPGRDRRPRRQLVRGRRPGPAASRTRCTGDGGPARAGSSTRDIRRLREHAGPDVRRPRPDHGRFAEGG